MKLKQLQILFGLIFFLCIGTTVHAQTIFFEEDFEADSITWLVENELGWMFDEALPLSSAYFDIPEHTRIAAVNDDAPGAGTATAGRMISPIFALTGTTPKLVIFDALFIDGDYNGDDESLSVEIRIEGSEEWERIGIVEGVESVWQDRLRASIPSTYDDMNVEIAFNYQDSDGWNYGAAVDNISVQEEPEFDATTSIQKVSLATITPVSQLFPFRVAYGIDNLGSNSLTNVVFNVDITQDGTDFDSAQDLVGNVADAYSNEYIFEPTEVGLYEFNFTSSESNLGDLGASSYSFEVSDSTFAKDDGVPELTLGFAFGDPSWYGYYGSEFFLENPDTLTSISVYIGAGSDASGTMNFVVNLFDELGESPSDEIFHSEEVPLDKADLGTFKHYQLPEPLPIPSGRFVVATGQDTIQGAVAFGFDDNEPVDAFWIVSPVAGGGYPWAYTINGNPTTMLIRPHFGHVPMIVSTDAIKEETLQVAVSPNPFSDALRIELSDLQGKAFAQITDIAGRIVAQTQLRNSNLLDWSLPNLTSGIYILTIQDEQGVFTQKVVKE